MDEFLEKLLKLSGQQHQARQSDAATSFLQMLDRSFGKLYTETDPVQAAAIRQIMHREAPINVTKPE